MALDIREPVAVNRLLRRAEGPAPSTARPLVRGRRSRLPLLHPPLARLPWPLPPTAGKLSCTGLIDCRGPWFLFRARARVPWSDRVALRSGFFWVEWSGGLEAWSPLVCVGIVVSSGD